LGQPRYWVLTENREVLAVGYGIKKNFPYLDFIMCLLFCEI